MAEYKYECVKVTIQRRHRLGVRSTVRTSATP